MKLKVGNFYKTANGNYVFLLKEGTLYEPFGYEYYQKNIDNPDIYVKKIHVFKGIILTNIEKIEDTIINYTWDDEGFDLMQVTWSPREENQEYKIVEEIPFEEVYNELYKN